MQVNIPFPHFKQICRRTSFTRTHLMCFHLSLYFISLSHLIRNLSMCVCRATSGTLGPSDFPAHGLVRDGTPCGDNLVCVNQTCVSIYPHIDQTKCPTNSLNMECFGQGVSDDCSWCFVVRISPLIAKCRIVWACIFGHRVVISTYSIFSNRIKPLRIIQSILMYWRLALARPPRRILLTIRSLVWTKCSTPHPISVDRAI